MVSYRRLPSEIRQLRTIPYEDRWWGILASDACERCNGRCVVPKVPGVYRIVIPCPKCAGTGRRGGR